MNARSSPLRFIHWCNLLSYASLGAWLMAVHAAVFGRSWAGAGAWIALAALADLYDGTFARLFDRDPDQQAFGMEIDSLVDVVAFGAGPVVCLLALTSPQFGAAQAVLFAAALVYLISTVTRLGFFNIASHDTHGFIGMPTTIAGLLWSTLCLMRPAATVVTMGFLITGALMVLPVSIPRPRGWVFLLFPAWTVGLVALHALR